jgi:hypothetical protein
MSVDEKIEKIHLQFLEKVYENSEKNIPIKGYIIGYNLGSKFNQEHYRFS